MSTLDDPFLSQGHPWTDLTTSTGSSAAVRTQIEQGAPADVFLSADTSNPEALVNADLTDGGVVEFATNSLVVVVPRGNPAAITSPADLARPGVRIIAASDGVPISDYSAQVIDRLSATEGYPEDFAAAYAANVVSKEDNVAAVTAKIVLGEGDAAIVYVTDAQTADAHAAGVETIEIPEAANVAAEYGGVVIRASQSRPTAHEFLGWLRSVNGQTVLSTFGFGPPR